MFHTKTCWVVSLHTLGVFENVLEIKLNVRFQTHSGQYFKPGRKYRERWRMVNTAKTQRHFFPLPSSVVPGLAGNSLSWVLGVFWVLGGFVVCLFFLFLEFFGSVFGGGFLFNLGSFQKTFSVY